MTPQLLQQERLYQQQAQSSQQERMQRTASMRNAAAEANNGTLVGTVVLQGSAAGSALPQNLIHAQAVPAPSLLGGLMRGISAKPQEQRPEFLVAPFNSRELLWNPN